MEQIYKFLFESSDNDEKEFANLINVQNFFKNYFGFSEQTFFDKVLRKSKKESYINEMIFVLNREFFSTEKDQRGPFLLFVRLLEYEDNFTRQRTTPVFFNEYGTIKNS